MATQAADDGNLVAVTTGSRVPGICIEVGPDGYGLSIGYAVRQKTLVVDSEKASTLGGPRGNPALRLNKPNPGNGLWALGHLSMNSVPLTCTHYATVTGKALLGLGAHVGGDDSNLTLGTHTRQLLAIEADDILLDLDQDAADWPGFDLFNARIAASHFSNLVTNSTPEAP